MSLVVVECRFADIFTVPLARTHSPFRKSLHASMFGKNLNSSDFLLSVGPFELVTPSVSEFVVRDLSRL